MSLKGQEWRDARATFTPIFSSSKMKMMIHFINAISDDLLGYVRAEAAKMGEGKIDVGGAFSKFSLETIASCAFGVKADSFKSGKSQFVRTAHSFFDFGTLDIARTIAYMIPGIKHLMDLLRLPVFKPKQARFFYDVLQKTIRHRMETKETRNDLIDLMIDAMKKDDTDDKKSKKEFDEILLIATATIVLIGGFDSTALTMAYTIWHLALDQEIQDKVRWEVDQAYDKDQAGDGYLSYAAVQELKYLDQVLQETLRRHPPFSAQSRLCTEDYRIPGTDVLIQKGVEINVPVIAIHNDEKYFPNPNKYDPDRFSPEETSKRHPMAFLPFSHGPRNCIGMRFAMLEAKVAVARMVRTFKLSRCPHTPEEVTYSPGAVTCRPKQTLWIRIEERD